MFKTCAADLTRCTDGYCRKSCDVLAFNGCPTDKPLQCPHGKCVNLISECAGSSANCPNDKPF